MTDEQDQLLVKTFPNLYRDRYGDIRSTGMYFGFQTGTGWFQLIRNLSEKLEKLILELPENERKDYCASQVKEKFGSLRFYMTCSTEEMDKLIDEAEDLSLKTCEECGKPGKINKGGWLSVRCKECRKKECSSNDSKE